MISEYIWMRNGQVIDDPIFQPGDTLGLQFPSGLGSSTVTLRDPMGNLRYKSRRSGNNVLETIRLPATKCYGIWSIELVSAQDLLMLQFKYVEEVPRQETPEEEVGEDDTQESEFMDQLPDPHVPTEDNKSELEQIDSTVIEEEEILPVATISETDHLQGERAIVESPELEVEATIINQPSQNEQLAVFQDAMNEIRELDTIITQSKAIHQTTSLEQPGIEQKDRFTTLLSCFPFCSLEDQLELLDFADSPEQFNQIPSVYLSPPDVKDLEIPIFEIDNIDIELNRLFHNNRIYHLSDLLLRTPGEIAEMVSHNFEEVVDWYRLLYKIADDWDHRLRVEYRIARYTHQAFGRDREKLVHVPSFADPIDRLSGITENDSLSLRTIGISTVGDLLEWSLVDLVNMNIVPDQPLLPKLWLANARAHMEFSRETQDS